MGIITCLLSTLAKVGFGDTAPVCQVGTYRIPRVDHDLTGQAIGDFARSVWTAFPENLRAGAWIV